jgi:site-specific DNA recombinase
MIPLAFEAPKSESCHGEKKDSRFLIMVVAVYLRVSTDEQRERQSINTQRDFAERYCALHSLAVYRVYADDGVTGTIPLEKRPEGSQILHDARLGKFDQLLIYKLDRLGRETRLILNAVAELEKLGVRVRSMTEEFDTGSSTGRLMLTLLSGFAAHERDAFRERSAAGILRRVAEAGAWLGGIVPYGYRKVGEKRTAQLLISDESIPGLAMSEADVIRDVFRMSAVEKKSCRVIATRLNDLRIPCAYTRDDRPILRGKRRERTSGMWRAGRIRALITNKTYMGIHEFGKRTRSGRPPIPRPVPAIVTEAEWKKAQANLKAHMLFGVRSAKNEYLLRGLIKCGLCGLTYIGTASNRDDRPGANREFYYRCNGTHSPSVYMTRDRKCQAKAIRGDELEAQVWSDIETFLRNPGPVLQQLHDRLASDAKGSDKTRQHITRLEGLLAKKAEERNRVLGLFRRGRLDDKALDAQMDEIGREETALERQLEELRGKVISAESIAVTVSSAEALLAKLRKRLDVPVSWAIKRQLVEILVANIRVDTTESWGVKQAGITVNYRFAQPSNVMPVVVTQAYTGNARVRIPTELRTIGDHIRRKRLTLKLTQEQVAERLGVTTASIYNWESDDSKPSVPYIPAIIEFLGYNPLPPATTLGERLVRHRTSLGLPQSESARRIGVDPGTLARWERGKRAPTGAFIALVRKYLAQQPIAIAS